MIERTKRTLACLTALALLLLKTLDLRILCGDLLFILAGQSLRLPDLILVGVGLGFQAALYGIQLLLLLHQLALIRLEGGFRLFKARLFPVHLVS